MVSALTVEQIQTHGHGRAQQVEPVDGDEPEGARAPLPVGGHDHARARAHGRIAHHRGSCTGLAARRHRPSCSSARGASAAPSLVLDRARAALLQNASAKSKLITFEQMYPSIAMLPSEDDAALAFAQVSTFMQSYVERHGQDALAPRSGKSRTAPTRARHWPRPLPQPFAKIEAEWKASLPTKAEVIAPSRRLRRVSRSATAERRSTEVEEGDARRFLRLGDLLWDAGALRCCGARIREGASRRPDDPIVAARFGARRARRPATHTP